jgi:hypothetical protein
VTFKLPESIEVTTPVELIVPTDGLVLAHVPPDDASEKVVVVPSQMADAPPVIGEMPGLIVMAWADVMSSSLQ